MPLFGGKKIDAVIVGVRYAGSGEIEWVRAYLKRGATWSDWTLIRRRELVERLKAGQKLVAGERIRYQAGTFNTAEMLQLTQANGKELVHIGAGQGQDRLEGVPVV